MTATNGDLREATAAGRFREDLYYRIHGMRIDLPPLRARGNDIVLLALHFLDVFAKKYGRPTPRFTDAAIDALRRYAWPGNVRELEHVVEQLALTCERDVIDVSDVRKAMRDHVPAEASQHLTLQQATESARAAHVQRVLASVGGNRTEAAKILETTPRTIRRILGAQKKR